MKTQFIPFSTGTSALDWQSYNCDKCHRRPYPARTALMACRNLTAHCVQLCGGRPYTQITPRAAFARLPARCESFTTVGKRRNPGKNTPWLLGGEAL